MSKLKNRFDPVHLPKHARYHWLRDDFETRAKQLSYLVTKEGEFEGFSLEYPKTLRMAAEELRCRGIDIDVSERLLLMAIFGPDDEPIWTREEIDKAAVEAELDNSLLRSAMFCAGANICFDQMMLSYTVRCIRSGIEFGPAIDLDRFEYVINPDLPYNRVRFLDTNQSACTAEGRRYE